MIRRFLTALILLGMTATAALAQGTKWPERPVRVIVPFAAGGPNDVVARLWVDRLTLALGQQFIVDNRGGASGMIGSEAAARAAPDGYTLLLASSSTLGLVPVVAKVNFDPLKDFTPMARVGDLIQGLAVNPTLKATNVAELVALAKATPGKIAWGTPGSGTGSHLMVVNFNRRAEVDILHVPYRGSADVLNDLIAGHVQVMSDIVVLPHVRAGKLRLLAMVGDDRHPGFPDTPTLAEQGFPHHLLRHLWPGGRVQGHRGQGECRGFGDHEEPRNDPTLPRTGSAAEADGRAGDRQGACRPDRDQP